MPKTEATIVIGAGPAGLAAGWSLRAAGVPFRILEQGSEPAHSWRNLYESLRLHTGKHLSSLPGYGFPSGTPLFPSRQQLVDYLAEYVDRFQLPVETSCRVLKAKWTGDGWHLDTSKGEVRARRLILATGIISNPVRANFPGMELFSGTVIHSVEYVNAARWKGKRVLVVGVGNSGAEIASELARAGESVAISARSGAHCMPLVQFGVPLQYWSAVLEKLPLRIQDGIVRLSGALTRIRKGPPVLPIPPWSPLEKPPVIGFALVDAIRSGRISLHPGIKRMGRTEVLFEDGTEKEFDAIILATGFRASVDFLEERFESDKAGFPQTNGVRCSTLPNCWVLGHRYATVGALANIRRDAMALRKEFGNSGSL